MSEDDHMIGSAGPSKVPTRSSARLADSKVAGPSLSSSGIAKKRPGSADLQSHQTSNKKQKEKEEISHPPSEQDASAGFLVQSTAVSEDPGVSHPHDEENLPYVHGGLPGLEHTSSPSMIGDHSIQGAQPIDDGASHMEPSPAATTDTSALTSIQSGSPATDAVPDLYQHEGPHPYPQPLHATGSLERFLDWITMPGREGFEVTTILNWQLIIKYFTMGWLCFGTGIDLDQKAKCIRWAQHPVIDSIGFASGGSGAKDRSLIPVNHNKPDCVITYMSIGKKQKLRHRVCMVIEAKPAREWNTSFPQIACYMMKSRVNDGCSMGLIVAGDAYRFLYWDKDERLYIVVPASLWERGATMTVQEAINHFAQDHETWDFGDDSFGASHRTISRRNFYRIFSHLEAEVKSIVRRQSQTPDEGLLKLGGCPSDLEGATCVEVQGIWEHKPGTSRPATNGLGMIPILPPDETRGGGDKGGTGTAGNVDQNQTGLAGEQNAPPSTGAAGDDAEEEDEMMNEEERLEKSLAIWPEWSWDTHREFYWYAKASRAQNAKDKIDAWAAEVPKTDDGPAS